MKTYSPSMERVKTYFGLSVFRTMDDPTYSECFRCFIKWTKMLSVEDKIGLARMLISSVDADSKHRDVIIGQMTEFLNVIKDEKESQPRWG